MTRLQKILRRQRFHANIVLRQNTLATFLYLKLLNILHIRQHLRLVLFDHQVTIRSGTPDLRVAIASLGREFQALESDYPFDGKGLIIDAGGYIGTAACALSRLYPTCTIVTIEPSSRNFKTLLKNTAGIDNIRAIKAALVNDPEKTVIDLMSRGNGEWGFTIIEKPNDHKARFLESVETVRIDDILEMTGHDRVFILKMDIEGGEHAFMTGGRAWLEKVDIFLVELHERIIEGCAEAFETCNEGRTIIRESGGKLMSIADVEEHEERARLA